MSRAKFRTGDRVRWVHHYLGEVEGTVQAGHTITGHKVLVPDGHPLENADTLTVRVTLELRPRVDHCEKVRRATKKPARFLG